MNNFNIYFIVLFLLLYSFYPFITIYIINNCNLRFLHKLLFSLGLQSKTEVEHDFSFKHIYLFIPPTEQFLSNSLFLLIHIPFSNK